MGSIVVVVVVAVVVVDIVVGADVVVIMVAVDDCVVAVGVSGWKLVSGWTLFSVLFFTGVDVSEVAVSEAVNSFATVSGAAVPVVDLFVVMEAFIVLCF